LNRPERIRQTVIKKITFCLENTSCIAVANQFNFANNFAKTLSDLLVRMLLRVLKLCLHCSIINIGVRATWRVQD